MLQVLNVSECIYGADLCTAEVSARVQHTAKLSLHVQEAMQSQRGVTPTREIPDIVDI
jgi:hypothetical protein